ncbi:929_t:CDS:2, partial [Cetraspora pellucida]
MKPENECMELEKKCKELQSDLESQNNESIKPYLDQIKELKRQLKNQDQDHKTLQTNYQNLDTKYRTLEASNQTIKTRYDDLENNYRILESESKNHEKSFSTNLNIINNLTKTNEDLKKTNEDLKKEATKYQSALGNATSFHLGHKDSDSAGQLSKDILDLHNILDKFCGLKKVAIINEPEINKLLQQNGCSISGGVKKNKNLISGLLERIVIETIIKKSNEYLESQEHDKDIEWGDPNLEMKIVYTTEQLLNLTKSIPEYRTGTDAVSKAISTKLRQQVYGVLGNRGFSNIGDKEHPLIVKLRSEINDLMNRYRTITNEEKLSENEAIIDTIIRQVINIFLFRLKVQEPVAEWKFFENKSSINTIMMEASLDSGDLEKLCVDVCAFPVIGSNLCEANQEDKHMKVIFPARIIPTKAISLTRISNNLDNMTYTKDKDIINSKYEKHQTGNNEYQNIERYSTTRMENSKQLELKRQTTGKDTEYQGYRIPNSRGEKYETSGIEDDKYQTMVTGNTGHEKYETLNDKKVRYTPTVEDTKQQKWVILINKYICQAIVMGSIKHLEQEISNNGDRDIKQR